jgi:cation:H+ antiporter
LIIEIFLFAIGITILLAGAHYFIKGGRVLADDIGISPLIIGLTFGAVGTSLPELLVSVMASFSGNSGIAIGNVVGSNIANIGLALGIGSLLLPVPVERDVIKYDYWVLLGTGVLFYVFIMNLNLTAFEGGIFIVCFIAYIYFLAKRHSFYEIDKTEPIKKIAVLKGILLLVIGIAGLVFGSKIIVTKAAAIAVLLGVSEVVIGIAVVAVGTSLPEVAVVAAGSLKKQHEISIGTIVGSNIINILLIAGTASIISPIVLKSNEIIFQAPAVLLFSMLLLPIIIDRKIKRFEGAILLALYVAYIYLIF